MKQIAEELQKIKDKGLFREFKWLEAPQGTDTVINGRKVLLLSSNSYLGLCNDARLKKAAINAIEKYGVGAGGSRLTTGSYLLHRQLELELARFKHTESAMIFNTGYMANLGTIAGLADEGWVIYCDRLNHASIIDGCRLSGAKLVIYKHCDPADLEKKLQRYGGGSKLIVTDGVFSMDGDIAPLKEIVAIARKYQALTMVDDAHATGVIGPNGGGTADYFGLEAEIDIQMGTLSKALAGEGGFVAGKRELIEYLRHRAKSFIYSTALAPPAIAVALEALSIVKNEPLPRKVLLENAIWLREQLAGAGFNVIAGCTPIIPLIAGPAGITVSFSQRLLEEGIYIPAIRPPTVHEGASRLRISIMATHTREVLQEAIGRIKAIGRELKLI
ncbi:MAG: 8-amino-7-oxononanoate synthase [Firmicutes bacterium]|nr:8-amino-7-oxononanoate synthase [Bacillota bacterium]